jgi:hypothetical protein
MSLPVGDEFKKLRKAFDHLKGNPNFDVITDYLKRRQELSLKQMATLTDEMRLRWLQGEVQFVSEILKLGES